MLETLTLDKLTAHKKRELAITFGELVYDGQWFSPLRKALSAFVTATQEHVTGKVRLELYKGNLINAGVWSPYSLYREDIATFAAGGDYKQSDATGFISIYGLPTKVQAIVNSEKEGGMKWFTLRIKKGVPSRTKVRAELPLVLSYAPADKQFRFFFLHCAASPHTIPFALVGSGYLIRSYSLPYVPRSCVPASFIPRCTYLSHLLFASVSRITGTPSRSPSAKARSSTFRI